MTLLYNLQYVLSKAAPAYPYTNPNLQSGHQHIPTPLLDTKMQNMYLSGLKRMPCLALWVVEVGGQWPGPLLKHAQVQGFPERAGTAYQKKGYAGHFQCIVSETARQLSTWSSKVKTVIQSIKEILYKRSNAIYSVKLAEWKCPINETGDLESTRGVQDVASLFSMRKVLMSTVD